MATTPLLDDAAPESIPASHPSNGERLKVGLIQTIAGPANIARALFSLGLSLKLRALAAAYRLIRSWIAPAEVDPERAITLSDGAAPSRPSWRKPLVISAIVAVVLAVGGVAFKLLRTPKAPPVAAGPPRVRAASGATGDSAPAPLEELDEEVVIAAVEAEIEAGPPAEEDPRKKGE